MSSNRLATLSPLASLVTLECLAAGDNRLGSFRGLEGVTNLVEAYLAANECGDLRSEVARLGKLPRLAVVDLWGNPLTAAREVRCCGGGGGGGGEGGSTC